MVKKPAYAIESVDNALKLLTLRQEREWLRIADAAKELGVSPSTAHRLMAILVYRGYALQDAQRRHCGGLNLWSDAPHSAVRKLVAQVRPRLEVLAAVTGETVNLVERVGTSARFLFSVEGPHLLRIGNRAGTVLPARTSWGGQVTLALLSDSAVAQLCRGKSTQRTGSSLDAGKLEALPVDLSRVLERGYALNIGLTEPDFAAVGAAVGQLDRPRILARPLSAPISRADALQRPEVVAALLAACGAVRRQLDA